jgi:hypothetical protein
LPWKLPPLKLPWDLNVLVKIVPGIINNCFGSDEEEEEDEEEEDGAKFLLLEGSVFRLRFGITGSRGGEVLGMGGGGGNI